MWVEKPKVRLIVEAAANEIRAAGVEPAVSDILWLAHLAENRISPSRVSPIKTVGVPVKCGRADLFRLTIAGDLWLRECANVWWPRPRHSLMAMLADLWVLAHGHDADAIKGAWGKRSARSAIVKWAAFNLPVSSGDVRRSLSLLSGGVDFVDIENDDIFKSGSDSDSTDWGEEIALLCAAYHKEPEYFLFRISIDQAARLLNKTAHAMGHPELAVDTAKDVAFGVFRLAVTEIIKRLTAEKTDG